MARSASRSPRRGKVASHGVFAMIVFVLTEVMFFGGLISAHTIAKTSALTVWPPPNQPRLPVEETLINTLALLVSGVLLGVGQRAFYGGHRSAARWLAASIALGAFFVVFQGLEWVALIGEGLTPATSTHGGFFYLIVGAHGVHAIAALLALGIVYRRLTRGAVSASFFGGASVFWYFVVVMWPILYLKVYL